MLKRVIESLETSKLGKRGQTIVEKLVQKYGKHVNSLAIRQLLDMDREPKESPLTKFVIYI